MLLKVAKKYCNKVYTSTDAKVCVLSQCPGITVTRANIRPYKAALLVQFSDPCAAKPYKYKFKYNTNTNTHTLQTQIPKPTSGLIKRQCWSSSLTPAMPPSNKTRNTDTKYKYSYRYRYKYKYRYKYHTQHTAL